MPTARPSAQYFLFDMDGLLLDTEKIYTQVTQQIVARFGKRFDWRLKGNMIGRPALDSARYLVEALQLPLRAEEYLHERDALLRKQFAHCDPLPGAEELVRRLHAHAVPMAVATSSSREMFELKITRHRDWFSLFNAVVTGDHPDIKNGKPAPDIFLLAAAQIGATPESTLVFEDAPSGLAAGLAAGMRVVAVPDPNMDKTRYRDADIILDSLTEFPLAEYGVG